MRGDVVDGGVDAVVGFADAAGSVGLTWLWVGDLGGRKGAALGNLSRGAMGRACLAGGARGSGKSRGWHIEDVEGAASRGLSGGGLSRVMGDVVAIHDVLE